MSTRTIWVLAVVLTALNIYSMVFAKQEAVPNYPQTKQWIIPSTIQYSYGDVRVIDTAAVCLYVLGESIAAVPKNQLPVGKGCQ